MKGTRHLLTVTFLCGAAALGQTDNSSGAVNSTQAVPRGTAPTPPLPNGTDNSAGTRLSGRVAVEDESVAPGGIAIEMVCSNLRRTVASTDSKGEFSFQYGGKANTVSDASEWGQRSSNPRLGISSGEAATAPRTVVNCDLRATLPGYESDEVTLTERHATDRSDVGTIMLHRVFAIDGVAVSSTSLNAPKKARDEYESGLKAMRSGRMDAAAKEFERAIAAYPVYANAWLELGRVRQQLGAAASAREAWKKATEIDPRLAGPYVELGIDAGLSHDWKTATQYLDRGLRLDPVDYPEAWFGDAVAHYYLGENDFAEKSAREAVRLDPKGLNPRAGYVLGMVLARKGDRAGAAAELREYLKAAPGAPDAELVKAQLAEIESGSARRE
ncbi:MAG TPA: tetratricopeptide repeat protein [Bryobacteraceae bacterium]|nr:tetratricopeptide repeat protein [Bryobacteraceae bacterium]